MKSASRVLGLVLITTLSIGSVVSQIPIDGNPRTIGTYRRAIALDFAANRRVTIQATAFADQADTEYSRYTTRQENLAYMDRGSKYFPNGNPIPGNENLDSQVIDPRTPTGFGNPFTREIHTSKKLAQAVIDESSIWNVTITVKIGDETFQLPIHNADFSEALSVWYSKNYHEFVEVVESKNINPRCDETEMDDDRFMSLYVTRYCYDHCHCFGHDHTCCRTCSYGRTVNLYECQYYKEIMDAQVAIAKSIMYQKRREECFGSNSGSSGGDTETGSGKTKQQIAANPIGLKKTKEHPMGKDVVVSKGVF